MDYKFKYDTLSNYKWLKYPTWSYTMGTLCIQMFLAINVHSLFYLHH